MISFCIKLYYIFQNEAIIMKLYYTNVDERIPEIIITKIKKDIEVSFSFENNDFKVNPTLYYRNNSKGLSPTVMNQAEYISKSFQKNLEKCGWEYDYTIIGQEIDGYIDLKIGKIESYCIKKNQVHNLISKISPDDHQFIEKIISLYQMYYQRNCFTPDPNNNIKDFTKTTGPNNYRIGLEFETGNIASSFRAFSKLNNLYEKNKIDIGVFITSHNKNVSTKIWPTSNRNGSLEELKKRDFEHELRFPYIVLGFEPEGWDSTCDFLHKTGTRYSLEENYDIISIKEKEYRYYKDSEVYTLNNKSTSLFD